MIDRHEVAQIGLAIGWFSFATVVLVVVATAFASLL
jgi:hypothetical protein